MARASSLRILASTFIMAIAFHASVFASLESNPYVDAKNQFSINPPSGWAVDSSGAYGTAVILYGPGNSSFRVSMIVRVETTSANLSDYVSTHWVPAPLPRLTPVLANYRPVSETSTTIGGVATYESVSTLTQGSYYIEVKLEILVQNQKGYVITSTALQTNYTTYQPAFDESVQTFKLTGSAFPWTIVIIGAVIAGGVAVGLTIFVVRKKRQVNIPFAMPKPPPSTPPPS